MQRLTRSAFPVSCLDVGCGDLNTSETPESMVSSEIVVAFVLSQVLKSATCRNYSSSSMSSWPWMRGTGSRVDGASWAEDTTPPIDPVGANDVRVAVHDVIRDHQEQIDAVRAGIEKDPLYEKNKHDDLWIVRFVLSHKKKIKPAIAAAKETLLFRHEHDLDAHDIRSFAPHTVKEGRVKEYWDVRCPGNALILTLPDPQRGVVTFIDVGCLVPGASDQLSYDTWEYAYIYSMEWTHQWVDYITRTTGRLTRSIRIVNMKSFQLSSYNRKDMKFDAKVMAKTENCYPQLLESIQGCNVPAVVHGIWALVRAILPKRAVEKFDIMNPKENKRERESLYRHISADHLPVEHGGLNTVSPRDW